MERVTIVVELSWTEPGQLFPWTDWDLQAAPEFDPGHMKTMQSLAGLSYFSKDNIT